MGHGAGSMGQRMESKELRNCELRISDCQLPDLGRVYRKVCLHQKQRSRHKSSCSGIDSEP